MPVPYGELIPYDPFAGILHIIKAGPFNSCIQVVDSILVFILNVLRRNSEFTTPAKKASLHMVFMKIRCIHSPNIKYSFLLANYP